MTEIRSESDLRLLHANTGVDHLWVLFNFSLAFSFFFSLFDAELNCLLVGRTKRKKSSRCHPLDGLTLTVLTASCNHIHNGEKNPNISKFPKCFFSSICFLFLSFFFFCIVYYYVSRSWINLIMPYDLIPIVFYLSILFRHMSLIRMGRY